MSLAHETLDIFSVVANRLGIWCLKADLEDLAFSVIHPQAYEALKVQVCVVVVQVLNVLVWVAVCGNVCTYHDVCSCVHA